MFKKFELGYFENVFNSLIKIKYILVC